MSQFREFFMSDSCITTESHQEFRVSATFPNGTITGKYIHVIEYAALEAAQKEIEQLKLELWQQNDSYRQGETHHGVIRRKLRSEVQNLAAALKVAEDALNYMTEDFDCDAEDVALFDMLKAKEALAEIQKIKKELG